MHSRIVWDLFHFLKSDLCQFLHQRGRRVHPLVQVDVLRAVFLEFTEEVLVDAREVAARKNQSCDGFEVGGGNAQQAAGLENAEKFPQCTVDVRFAEVLQRRERDDFRDDAVIEREALAEIEDDVHLRERDGIAIEEFAGPVWVPSAADVEFRAAEPFRAPFLRAPRTGGAPPRVDRPAIEEAEGADVLVMAI